MSNSNIRNIIESHLPTGLEQYQALIDEVVEHLESALDNACNRLVALGSSTTGASQDDVRAALVEVGLQTEDAQTFEDVKDEDEDEDDERPLWSLDEVLDQADADTRITDLEAEYLSLKTQVTALAQVARRAGLLAD